jgi:hypothetical protein
MLVVARVTLYKSHLKRAKLEKPRLSPNDPTGESRTTDSPETEGNIPSITARPP